MPYVLANAQTVARVPFPHHYPISPTDSSGHSSPLHSGPPSPKGSEDADDRNSRPRKKSSLKQGRPYHTPSPSSRSSPLPRSKSFSDGMPKLVHFPSQDTELQHVRTFSMAARPISISNQGSDDDDDSENDDDGESFPAPDSGKYRIEPSLSRLPNPVAPIDGVVKLDTLDFSNDAVLRGRVRVGNVAYSKRVAARFSLDGWESTSEVLASYLSSSPCGRWDIWTFSIRLEDITLKNRTLLLCIHFAAEGAGEWWDNNNGANYSVGFVRDASTPLTTHWEPTHFPRRRSATVGSAPMASSAMPHVHQNRGQGRGAGWQGWTQNVHFKPQRAFPSDSVPRSGKPLFVM